MIEGSILFTIFNGRDHEVFLAGAQTDAAGAIARPGEDSPIRYDSPIMLGYSTYSVSPRDREPLLRWMVEALESEGCRVLRISEPDRAPFRLTFETPSGERMGILAYAFLANSKPTRNRPPDEHRFQIKYGKKTADLHTLWQDPFELYTTLFFGINLERDFFVAADPAVHNPTRFFISLEFKERNADEVLTKSWASWEREKKSRGRNAFPTEVLVGGTKKNFLRLVRFERIASGLSPGHRQLLAEILDSGMPVPAFPDVGRISTRKAEPVPHAIAQEFELSQREILDLVDSAPRLKMAVRGWVAEVHLHRQLLEIPGVENCQQIEEEGGADIRLNFRGSRPLEIECKNVLRNRLADGTIRLDFQRTRASKSDPCSRFYSPSDFDLVAACLHSCTESWEFRYVPTAQLDPHRACKGKLSHLVRLDERWIPDASRALEQALKIVS